MNPANDVLWAVAVDVEEHSRGVQAKAMLARGLQECPTSGLLWSMLIWAEARPTRAVGLSAQLWIGGLGILL